MSDAGARGKGQSTANRVQGPGPRKRTGGFTLIEVLLAISIMAFVVSIIYASFSTTSNNVKEAEARRDGSDLARTLLIKMSDDIANAYVIGPGANAIPTIFYGKNELLRTSIGEFRHDSLSLTTLTNWRRANSKETDLWEVGYFFKEKEDRTGYVLMRREKRELSKETPVLEGGTEYEITDKVTGLQIRYSSDGKTWKDGWDSRSSSANRIPKIVDIGLTLASGETYSIRTGHGKSMQR